MSEWVIKLPYRDRSDPIAEAGIAAVEAIADPEERAVAVNVVSELMLADGIVTVGDALDRIERASGSERRALLDRARVTAGLDTCADAETHARYVAVNKAIPTVDAHGNAWKGCAAEGCRTFPTDHNGACGAVGCAFPVPLATAIASLYVKRMRIERFYGEA